MMGVFANELQGPDSLPCLVEVRGDSGFAALGKTVPFFRRSAGDAALKEMGFGDADERFSMIAEACGRIERDDPHGALEGMFRHRLDATGCYRLLATLLAAAAPPAPAPASFLDLVEA